MAIEKRSEGFGDDFAKLAKTIGADVFADNMAKMLGYDDCGCADRQKEWNSPDLLVNKIFYKKKEEDENIEEQGS
jgi:hypothetical protein